MRLKLGAQDLHPYLTKRFDLSEDIGTPSTTANTQQLILNEVPDDEYRDIIQMLNKEQKEFFYHVLHPMKIHSMVFLVEELVLVNFTLPKPCIRQH